MRLIYIFFLCFSLCYLHLCFHSFFLSFLFICIYFFLSFIFIYILASLSPLLLRQICIFLFLSLVSCLVFPLATFSLPCCYFLHFFHLSSFTLALSGLRATINNATKLWFFGAHFKVFVFSLTSEI